MFSIFRNWWHRRIIDRSDIPEADWLQAFARLPILHGLAADEAVRLQGLAILFLHKKVFSGAHGLEVTRGMELIIALQACLPILNLGIRWYAGWSTVIVYPAGFAPQRTVTDAAGVVHESTTALSGEAWQRGPVVLSWQDTEHAGELDGENLVIHEFSHKLDMFNGIANGFPPLHKGMDAEAWATEFGSAFADFQRKTDAGIATGISGYAATAPAEFFAVLSEVFFERPLLIKTSYPAVYEHLKLFYRQDPERRLASES